MIKKPATKNSSPVYCDWSLLSLWLGMAPTSCNRVVYLDKVFHLLLFLVWPLLILTVTIKIFLDFVGFFWLKLALLLAAYWDHSVSIKMKKNYLLVVKIKPCGRVFLCQRKNEIKSNPLLTTTSLFLFHINVDLYYLYRALLVYLFLLSFSSM